MDVTRGFENTLTARQPERFEREGKVPLSCGALFQRDLAGDAIARQFVGTVVTQSSGRAPEIRERILPLAIFKMRREYKILGGLHGAEQACVLGGIAMIGQHHVDRHHLGRCSGHQFEGSSPAWCGTREHRP